MLSLTSLFHKRAEQQEIQVSLYSAQGGGGEHCPEFLMFFSHAEMVYLEGLYLLGHLVTGQFWYRLKPGSVFLNMADLGWYVLSDTTSLAIKHSS
jgi:hypothetical protein